LEVTDILDMSQPQLKLVWTSHLAVSSRPKKRRQQMENQVPSDRDIGEEKAETGLSAWFDRKQIVTAIVTVLLTGALTVIGLIATGVWSMFSENLETRIVKKLEESSAFSGAIASKIQASDTLSNAIVTQLRRSDEIKSIKTIGEDVGKIKERLAGINEQIRSLERQVYTTRATALGIADPNIQSIALTPKEQFKSVTPIAGKQPVFFR
jgi:hypothetical protein